MWNRIKIYLIPILIMGLSILLSYLVYDKFDIGSKFDDSDLITHYGLFLGFGLTIYTFIISVLDNIVKRIDKNVKIANKRDIVDKVFSSVRHLKQDVFAIFIILILQLILITFNAFFVENCVPVLIIKHALLIYSLFILLDICLVLFGIAEISLTLLKERKNEQEE